MAPPAAATAGAAARREGHWWSRSAPDGAGDSGVHPSRRPGLEVVPRSEARRRRIRRGRLIDIVAVCLVLTALLAVVIGQAMLANGQVRLAGLQQELALEQASHRQQELTVAELETPARIVAAASGQLHMIHQSVVELPYVSLSTPLPAPKVAPAPPPAAASSTSTTTP